MAKRHLTFSQRHSELRATEYSSVGNNNMLHNFTSQNYASSTEEKTIEVKNEGDIVSQFFRETGDASAEVACQSYER